MRYLNSFLELPFIGISPVDLYIVHEFGSVYVCMDKFQHCTQSFLYYNNQS